MAWCDHIKAFGVVYVPNKGVKEKLVAGLAEEFIVFVLIEDWVANIIYFLSGKIVDLIGKVKAGNDL